MIPIRSKKVVLSVIIGTGLLAVAFAAFSPNLAEAVSDNSTIPEITGSVNVHQTIKDYITDKRTVSLSEASSIAEKEIANGAVVGGHMTIEQGFLVYRFFVMDTESETSYFVLVDAGDAKVLYKSEGIDFKAMHGFGQGGFGMGKFGHGSFGGHSGKMMFHQQWSEDQVPQEQTPQESQ